MNHAKILFVAMAVMILGASIAMTQAEGITEDINAPDNTDNDNTGNTGAANPTEATDPDDVPSNGLNNDPGFFKRIWRAMIGNNQGNNPTLVGSEDNSCDGASTCYTTEGKVLCESSYNECLQKYGRCHCGEDNPPEQASSCPNGLLYCKADGEEIRCTGAPEEQQCIEKYGKDNCYCSQPTSQDDTTEQGSEACDKEYMLICNSEGSQIQCAGGDQKECMDKYGKNNCFCKSPPTANSEDKNNGLICDPCETVICKYGSGGIFVCPGDIKSCIMKFGDSCQKVGCYRDVCTKNIHVCKDPKTGASTQCKGSLESCNERYDDRCICGVPPVDSNCQDNTHLCYVKQDLAGQVTTDNNQPQQCQGKYEDCLAKYKELGGTCQCGIPQTPTCDKKIHLCMIDQNNAGATSVTPSSVNCEGSYNECVAKFGQCRCGTPETQYCKYEDKKYRIGSEWNAGDGCNICACKPNGVVACTTRACSSSSDCEEDAQTCYTLSPSSVAASQPIKCQGTMKYCTEKYGNCKCGWDENSYCTYNGARYKYGESFKDSDGCNVCNCLESGQVTCTDRACSDVTTYCDWQGAKYKIGENWGAGDNCNTCSCTASLSAAIPKVTCTTKVCRTCDEQRNVCTTASGAKEYCSGSYDDCAAKYKSIGGICSCGGTIDTAIGKQSYRMTVE